MGGVERGGRSETVKCVCVCFSRWGVQVFGVTKYLQSLAGWPAGRHLPLHLYDNDSTISLPLTSQSVAHLFSV